MKEPCVFDEQIVIVLILYCVINRDQILKYFYVSEVYQ